MSLIKESWKFKYDEALITENIERVFEMETLSIYQKSLQWYPLANNIAREYAIKYNKPLEIVAGLISVLSPQKSWHHNLILTKEFLECGNCGHMEQQLKKAKEIIGSEGGEYRIEWILGGEKTKNFFRNILDPLDKNHVTIDFHMCQLLTGNFNYKNPTDKQYQFLKSIIIKFAEKIHRTPCDLQASLWLTWKENKHQ